MVNKQTEAIFGYERHELIGRQVEILMPDGFRSKHRDHRAHYYSNPKVRTMGPSPDPEYINGHR
jgi:PAS domain S-box-containing protein